MGRGSESFQKRQREKNKRERAAAKQARRHGKLEVPFEEEEVEAPSSNGKSEAELYEDFRLLSEKYQSGGMDEETYEKRRVEIFEQLGLEVH